MTPPCYTFPAAELQERVQLDVHGRQRKMLAGAPAPATLAKKKTESKTIDGQEEKTESIGNGVNNRLRSIDLARDCTLLSSMVQYSCAVMHPEMRDSPVRCWPVQRMFRRCQDRHGSFMVETTAWEGNDYASRTGSEESSAGNTPAESALGSGPSLSLVSSSSTISAGAAPSQRSEALRVFG